MFCQYVVINFNSRSHVTGASQLSGEVSDICKLQTARAGNIIDDVIVLRILSVSQSAVCSLQSSNVSQRLRSLLFNGLAKHSFYCFLVLGSVIIVFILLFSLPMMCDLKKAVTSPPLVPDSCSVLIKTAPNIRKVSLLIHETLLKHREENIKQRTIIRF